MADGPVRILILEDQDDDAALVQRELVRAGLSCAFHRAVDRPSFVAGLRDFSPELILSDHNLIGFTGTEALGIASEVAPTTPFVFVSGTIGEEAAIDAMRRGATDYVIKDRLTRLVPVVQRALREAADRRERQRLEREFVQAQKMESLGRMASSIAHDFNNVLAIILGSASMIEDASPDASAKRLAGDVTKAAERGQDLTGRLLAFSRNQPGEAREFDLNARLAEFGGMAGPLLGQNVTLRTAYDPAPLTLRGDPGTIDQVIMNLLVNARDAMPDGGTVIVSTARLEAADEPPAGFALVPPGAYARLTVADTGTGMSAEVKARLFEPFFTTKPAGRGTGLGLATVYGVVRQFGGGINVESAPGHGTEFQLLFPLAEETAPSVVLSGKAVLLVDDEHGIRAYARQILEAAGCRVTEAADGREALAAFERAPAEYALLITDVMMAGMDGFELAARVRALRAGCPVVMVSGVPGTRRRAESELPGARFLAKPFGPGELTRAARSAVAG